MVLDAPFFILRVGGQEELIDLGRPVEAGDDSVGGVIGICKGQAMRKALLP